MLYIHLSYPDNCITAVDYYFDRHKRKDWFNNQMVKDIIFGIDKTIAVKDEYLESPIFGGMSPDRLSTGCKATILLYVQDRPVYISCCGDNCAKYIENIGRSKDIHGYLLHCMEFPENINCVFADSNLKVDNYDCFIDEFYRLEDLGVMQR